MLYQSSISWKSYLSTFHKTNKIHVYDFTKYNNEAIDLEKITLTGKFESAICILVIYVHYIVLNASFDLFYLIYLVLHLFIRMYKTLANQKLPICSMTQKTLNIHKIKCLIKDSHMGMLEESSSYRMGMPSLVIQETLLTSTFVSLITYVAELFHSGT